MTRRYRVPRAVEIKNPFVYLFYALIEQALSDVEDYVKGRKIKYSWQFKLRKETREKHQRYFLLDALLFLTNTIDDWLIKYSDILKEIDIDILKEMINNRLKELGMSHLIPLSFEDFQRLMSSEAKLSQLLHPGD